MRFKFWVATLFFILSAFVSSSIAENAKAQADASVKFGNIPISFEPAPTPGSFISRSGRYAISLGAQESLIAVRASQNEATQLLRFTFEKSNPSAQLEALDPLKGVTNYYVGNDSRNWRVGVPTFAKVRAKSVYPGVDVIYYGDHRRLEFDFVVAPGADPRSIALAFSGMKSLHTAEGELVVEMDGQALRFAHPYAYQRVGGKNVPVEVDYSLLSANQVQLRIGEYDKNLELVIDPVISYATFLGGSQADNANGMALNSAGEAFITGQTCSADFFTASPNPSGTIFKGSCDAYVSKLSADGSSVLYTTYLAGTAPEPVNATAEGNGIALDAGGRAYVVGKTNFRDMPTVNLYQGGDSDAFVTILDTDGTLLRAAYLGGNNADTGLAIAVDAQQNVIAAGQTCSSDFPAYNGFQGKTEKCVAFATKLDYGLHIPPQGTGTSALSPKPPSAADACGVVCPATPDASQTYYFFSVVYGGQLVPPEPTWPYGTYSYPGPVLYGTIPVPAGAITIISVPPCTGTGPLQPYVLYAEASGIAGGLNSACGPLAKDARVSDNGGFNWHVIGPYEIPVFATTKAYGVALDPVGDAFVVGGTNTSSLVPFTQFDGTGAWILKVAARNGMLIYSTALGKNATDVSETINAARAITVDTQGRAYVVGTTTGGIFTTTSGVNFEALGGQDVFALRMNTAGSGIDYSTYLGGSGNDQGLAVTVDAGGWAYITGSTKSSNLPILNAILDPNNTPVTQLRGLQDAYVAKLSPDGGALIMSAYFGGSGLDQGNAIAVNSVGDIYLAGNTTSPDLPVMPPADTAHPVPGKTTYAGNTDAFVAKILGTSFPKATVSTINVDFGSQTVGTASASKTVTLKNTGNGVLTITGITVTGDYTQTNNCGTQLSAAGGTKDQCTITLVFTPTSVGTRSGAVSIVDDSADSPQLVGLTGLGTLVSGTISPASLTFASIEVGKTTASQSITITNTDATHRLGVTSVVASGDFKVSSNGCTVPMAPGAAACSINVTFTPTATGTRSGTLVINGNASVFPASIPLSGTGAQSAPDFTMTGPPVELKILRGATGSFDLTVSPVNGFNQHVNVTCLVPLPATCAVSPGTLDAGTTSKATITVNVPAGTGYNPKGASNRRLFGPELAFCIMGLAIVGRRRRFWIAALIVVVCCTALMFTGCSGGGGASSSTISGMSPGSYSMSVTATYSGGGTTLTHSSNINLVVQ